MSVAHPGTGQYEITMKNVVTYCALTGSFHGGTGLVGFSLPDVNIVHVNTRTLIGNDANAEFSVVMAC